MVNVSEQSTVLDYAILRLLEFQEATGGATCLTDADIASATGAELGEVRLRLEHLEARELVELVKVPGPSYAALLGYHRPRLRLLAGHLKCFHRSRP